MKTKTRHKGTGIPREKTNVFGILPGHGIYVDPKTKPLTPWIVFQMFLPFGKFDFLFGAN